MEKVDPGKQLDWLQEIEELVQFQGSDFFQRANSLASAIVRNASTAEHAELAGKLLAALTSLAESGQSRPNEMGVNKAAWRLRLALQKTRSGEKSRHD